MGLEGNWTEWHLTERGWEVGGWQTGALGRQGVPAPEDRVLTYLYRELNLGQPRPVEITHNRTWTSGNEAVIKPLIERFGESPRQLYSPVGRKTPPEGSK
jgi:hypothetical protein